MSQNNCLNTPEEIITLTDDEENDIIEKNKSEEIISLKLNKSFSSDEKFIETEIINDNNDTNNDIIKQKGFLSKKRKRDTPKKFNFNIEFKLFYKIVEKYGIEKALSSLCKSKETFTKNALDQIMDKIFDSCDKNKFITSIIKTYYDLLEDYISNDIDIKQALLFKNNFDQQRIISKDEINNESTMLNFEFNVNNMIELPLNKKGLNNNDNYNYNNNTQNKKNTLGLECHFNKNEDGNVYKYKIVYLLGGLAIFKCDDDACNGDAIFDLDKKVFNIGQKHTKEYSEHKFVKNGILDNSIIYNEMNSNKYQDAQILFEGYNKIVRFYS